MGGADPKAAIRVRARSLGFDAVGFAPAAGHPGWGENLAEFVGQNRHGTMTWMAERVGQRSSPTGLWAEARSVIVLGMSYAPGPLPDLPADRGNIAVYARGRDYHDTVKARLKALGRWMAETFSCQLKVFVDTAPVMEKPLAAASGIGWQGRHTNIVSRNFGSWLFLAEIYTTLELEPDPPEPDHCGSCRACETACPTAALVDGRIDARRCISYLTIEHKGPVAEDLRAAMGNRVYGCDDCTLACPWNKFAPPTSEPDFQPRIERVAPSLADLAALDDAAFRQVFAGSAIKRTGRDRFVRNVLIAIGNSGDPSLAPVARRLAGDPDPDVAEAAAWALAKLDTGGRRPL